MRPWAKYVARLALSVAVAAALLATGCSVDKLSIEGGKVSPFKPSVTGIPEA